MNTLIRSLLLHAVFLLAAFATAAHAGTFSNVPWTDDASSGIVAGQTSWAYHFGSSAAATVNTVPVTGIATTTVNNANFQLAGTTSINSDPANNINAGGSAIIADNFVFNGAPATITVKNLTAGKTYTVSFLSVAWEAPGTNVRLLTFASGADSLDVDQDRFGDNNGIRIDYTFTADATTRVITVSPHNAGGNTFHL